MSRTWVVVPMYNEGSAIGQVVRDLRANFDHIVCIDDGSVDDSAQIAAAAGATVIRHPINLGQGASLQTGFDFALQDPETTEVVTFDADGQHQVADAVAMVALLRERDLGVVFGSRFLDDRTELPFLKNVVLRLVACTERLSTGMRLTDAHNGLRVIRRDVLSQIRLRQNRMAHASELVAHIGDAKVAWQEFPTHIVYTEYSKSKGQSLLNGVNILVELLFR